MRIGIDIDDTLTDVQDKLTDAAFQYAKSLNKIKNNKVNQISDSGNDGSIYQKLFDFSYEELKYFLGPIQEEITNNALPRDYCVDIIKKLHDEGNEIYIITARDEEFHDNPYKQSREWLRKNNIYFDKLIVNARDKGKVCVENNIDLFIDDNLKNCKDVLNYGIESITICNDNKEGIKNYNNWKEIYNFIINNNIVKIIDFNDNFKTDVCCFINECMHHFIGRPYKERLDVSNIKEYYYNNNGKFWLAVDVKTNKIIGTIALENCNTYGILKRFYVSEEYQNLFIGKRLYNIFENHVIEKTNIMKIYLACGNVLEKAHRFYKNNGYIQIDKLDIDMHYAKDDDFFVKFFNN